MPLKSSLSLLSHGGWWEGSHLCCFFSCSAGREVLKRGVPRKGFWVCSQPLVLWMHAKHAECAPVQSRCKVLHGVRSKWDWGLGCPEDVLVIKVLLQGNEFSLFGMWAEGYYIQPGCWGRTHTDVAVVPMSKACVHEIKPATSMLILQLVEAREELGNTISSSAAAWWMLFTGSPVSVAWVSKLFLLLPTPLIFPFATYSGLSWFYCESIGKCSGGELCMPFLPSWADCFPKGSGMDERVDECPKYLPLTTGCLHQQQGSPSSGWELALAWCGGCPDL